MNLTARSFCVRRSIAALALINLSVWGLSCSGDSAGPDPNQAPGKPQAPQGSSIVVIDLPATFSSSASDPENDPVSLWFYWGDGDSTLAGPAPAGSSVSASHSYSVLGSFRIRVVGVDSDGLRSIDSDELRINVLQQGPVAPGRPIGPDSLGLNTRQTFSVQAVSLASGLLSVKFFWDDGDSTLSAWDTSGATFSAEHIYFDTGSFLVRVRGQDDSGRVSPLSLPKTVVALNNPPLRPGAPFGPLSAAAEQLVTFYASAVDPEGQRVALTFHWGDGTSMPTPFDSPLGLFSSTHKYTDTGMFQVRVSAEDIFGGQSDTSLGTWIHIPIFAIDTVFIAAGGLAPVSVTLNVNGRIRWINQDIVKHVVTPDIPGVFPAQLIKAGASAMVTMSVPGSFGYHDADNPANANFQGTIFVRP